MLVSGCGSLASEPGIVSTAPVPTVTPTLSADVGHPVARVDLADGAALFNGPQGCQTCHGTNGHGDGSVAANFSCQLPNVADPNTARTASVADWFAITTNGNSGDQTCLMPPWNTTLSEQQRWNVASYLYSLHYTSDMLHKGAQIWTDNCAACHGDHGAGDGPKASLSSRPVPNFSEPAYLISYSDAKLYTSVTNGVGAAMPAFGSKLDDNSRWAAVAYLRAMTWSNSGASNATPAATAAAESLTLTVSGTISNGTPGGTVPGTLPLTLHVIASNGTPHDLATVQGTATDGKFTFPDVARQIGQAYVITAQYAGVQQFGTPVKLAEGAGETLDLSFSIYDLGSNAADVVVTQQTVILDFSGTTGVTVNEGLNFQNAGQRIYLTDQTDANGSRVSIRLPLPNGANTITLDPAVQGQFEVVNGPPSTVISALPLFPGESRPLQFSYTVPLTGRLDLAIPSPYTIQAFTVYVPQQSGLAIADSGFPADSPITLQDSAGQNVAYNGYRMAVPSRAGTTIELSVASQSDLQNADAIQRRNTLAIVVTLALCAFALVAAIMWRLNRLERVRRTQLPAAHSTLVAQIAALDEQFEAGKVPQPEYETRRALLKTRLVEEMNRAHS